MKRKIIGIIVFMIGFALFAYFGIWICLINGIIYFVVGLRDYRETGYVMMQILKIIIGFPIVELVSFLMMLVGCEIYKS